MQRGECAGDVRVTPSVTIPAGELTWRFSRSSGAGGQHVNTSDTRVELSWGPSRVHGAVGHATGTGPPADWAASWSTAW